MGRLPSRIRMCSTEQVCIEQSLHPIPYRHFSVTGIFDKQAYLQVADSFTISCPYATAGELYQVVVDCVEIDAAERFSFNAQGATVATSTETITFPTKTDFLSVIVVHTACVPLYLSLTRNLLIIYQPSQDLVTAG
jgi:hypothetical protein